MSREQRNCEVTARKSRTQAGTKGKFQPYYLLRADASQIPLATNSADLVIATPPFPGEKRFRQREFCTSSIVEYEAMTRDFLLEAVRIVRPSGYILFHTDTAVSPMPKIFDVLQKRKRRQQWVAAPVRRERHKVRSVSVKNFYWAALPVGFYRELIVRYSRPGETVVHVFSGSGNSGLAAMDCSRKPILIDLCYQRVMKKRLEDRARALADSRCDSR